jgi:hypothetical protein
MNRDDVPDLGEILDVFIDATGDYDDEHDGWLRGRRHPVLGVAIFTWSQCPTQDTCPVERARYRVIVEYLDSPTATEDDLWQPTERHENRLRRLLRRRGPTL